MMKMTNFRISSSDRALLERISEYYSDASMSAILRRLIRNEAKQIGITPVDDATQPDAAQTTTLAEETSPGKTHSATWFMERAQ